MTDVPLQCFMQKNVMTTIISCCHTRQLVCQTLWSGILLFGCQLSFLTWGHSWVVFDQHPMQQKGSLESVAGHLPWLSCWCSPASRVPFFPSYYFRCRQQQNTGPAAAGFRLLNKLQCERNHRANVCSSRITHRVTRMNSQLEEFTRTQSERGATLGERKNNKKKKTRELLFSLPTPFDAQVQLPFPLSSSSLTRNKIHTHTRR